MKQRVKDVLTSAGLRVERISDEERRLARGYDPMKGPGTRDAAYLSSSNPRLQEIEAAYAADEQPMGAKSLWSADVVADDVELHYFRGDNLFVWQYTRSPQINRYRNFIFARHVQSVDRRGLLDTLREDGAFGCFTWEFPDMAVVSRDLLDSVLELDFLDRHLQLFDRPMRVLDIGAGYGRLAHRMLTAAPNVEAYYCTDAVPRSTFLCEFYLRFRGLDRATVVPLPDVRRVITPGTVDVAVNVHSFSEMPSTAIRGWLKVLADAEVEHLLIVPNEEDGLFSREPDGQRRPCRELLRMAGYDEVSTEQVITDTAVREILNVRDRFYLYKRVGPANPML